MTNEEKSETSRRDSPSANAGSTFTAPPAEDGLRKEAIEDKFQKAEEEGLLRFQVLPDEEMYDDSYVDTWTDVSEEERVKEKLDLWRRIEREGVWGVVVEKHFHCDACGADRWDHVDSCWGFVGDDWKDSGHDLDFKEAGLIAIGIEV